VWFLCFIVAWGAEKKSFFETTEEISISSAIFLQDFI